VSVPACVPDPPLPSPSLPKDYTNTLTLQSEQTFVVIFSFIQYNFDTFHDLFTYQERKQGIW
jgi:hypothetical protein